MGYELGGGIWTRVFAVPNIVADEYLKIASGLSVKILLILLRRGEVIPVSELAGQLGQSTCDIQDSLNFWIESGILVRAEAEGAVQEGIATRAEQVKEEEIVPQKVGGEAPAQTATSGEPAGQVKIISSGRPRITPAQIAEMSKSDEIIAFLLQESQSVFGKTLTAVASEMVISLYTYHGLPPDVILMLIRYCVGIGKSSPSYISTAAENWAERGITSHTKAESEIKRLTENRTREGKIKACFGIYDRSLTPKEKQYIEVWTGEFGFNNEMITLAYERTIDAKGSLRFDYINGILVNWNKNGVRTPEDAARDTREKKAAPAAKNRRSASYDGVNFDDIIANGKIV